MIVSATRIRNLTPHELNIECFAGGTMTIPADGQVARCETVHAPAHVLSVDGIDIAVANEALGPVVDLPEPEVGVVLVVSRLVAEAVPHRADVYAPGRAIRAYDGRIVGAKGLVRCPGIDGM